MIIGANYLGYGKCEFTVWAPFRSKVELEFISPRKEIVPLIKKERGYWSIIVENISDVASYRYILDGQLSRPDPASRYQPEGVHGPSRFFQQGTFTWGDEAWKGIPLAQMVIYELHVGTFTPEGTFRAIIPRLETLKEIGINAIELMPVAQFPGERNWGYDGAYPFAVQNSYGGLLELKDLVNECHQHGIAVVLDVVYNHLGPEGNYFADFGPYFTDKYKTPWGKAVNFDGAYSDEVRNYFIQNAFFWFDQVHIDALRLDAVHAIYDTSAHPFLQELAEEVEKFSIRDGRKRFLIAESNLNDTRFVKPRAQEGLGMDAQWNDDFHHCLHTLLTSEKSGYYEDFGEMSRFVKCLKEGFAYSGQFSQFRMRQHGNSSVNCPAAQFVVFSQNHDQIGNRMLGERLSILISFEALKAAATLTLLSPYVPLLFMGEEYGEKSPFLYFVSHSDSGLIEAVRKGRKEEFEKFDWSDEPPDPQSVETFKRSRISWEARERGDHKVLMNLYQVLLTLRRNISAFKHLQKNFLEVDAYEDTKVLVLRRWYRRSHGALLVNLGDDDSSITNPFSRGKWKKILDTSDPLWHGPGSLLPASVYTGEKLIVRGFSAAVFQTQR